jgi:RNA polymerase sigma-70 factor (ECF subfamily)
MGGVPSRGETTTMSSELATDPVAWVDRHGDALYRFAVLRVRDRTVAEDLVQETLLAALQARDTPAVVANERAWLLGILRHKVFDHFRRVSRDRTPADPPTGDEHDGGDDFDERGRWAAPPARWSSPEHALEQEEFLNALDACMDELPARQRHTFVLRELDGIASDDLAEALGTSRNNVFVLLSRARQHLRDCLELHWFGR